MWLKSHADGSHHTRRAYERIGRRFVEALAAAGTSLKRATVEDVQNALEAMRTKADGSTSSAASVNTYVAAVKALLGFARKVGYTRFNAAPLIKLSKAPRKTAQRLLSQVELHLLLRAARSRRDRLMLEVALFRRAARLRACGSHLGAGPSTRDRRGPACRRRQGRQAAQIPDPRRSRCGLA